MSERDRDLLVELDAAGIAPFNLRVQAGLLPQGLFPAVSSGPILPAISASRTSSVAKVSSCCLAIKAGRTCTASAITSMAQSTRTHTSMYPSPRRDLKIRFSTWLPPRLKSDPFPDTEHYIRSKYWR